MFLLPEVHILGPFSDIYDNGENPCLMNQKCKKLIEFWILRFVVTGEPII